MNDDLDNSPANTVSRRAFLCGSAAWLAGNAGIAAARTMPPAQAPNTSALKRDAQRNGKILGMFTGAHELSFDPVASAIIANTFSMIAVGNDLKFSNRLRPTPYTYDFSNGDKDVSWAEQHGLLFRGHCLVWWNALPDWFNSYVTTANARQVMTDHISAVVKHFAGRVYSWDVVNEPIHNDSPDNLRRKPWIDLVGPEYIDLAFRTAHTADPGARLVLNECFIEHATPGEVQRRDALLGLVTQLKKANVPISAIGIQGHLRGTTPLDKPGMTTFLKKVQALGLDIMITELDVDDTQIPGPEIDRTVAAKYSEFLDLVMPYVKLITFEQLIDDPGLPRRPDGLLHRPNLFDASYQPTPAYRAVQASLDLSKSS